MWLLENAEAFQGRRLWLRPGKTYLFGRTAAEPGQLAISHNTISRKHLTITLDEVEEGHAHHLSSRSKVTIEDLATKIGTVVNGQKIKGKKHVVESEEAEIIMGKCPSKFRLSWLHVVFTFSFTNRELQAQPLTNLRDQFEHLDIKLLTDYNTESTTHVISKKRNTAKGLQALINGKYIVTETFLDAILQAAELPEAGGPGEASPLEQDFDGMWPDAMQHLPPPGGEPVSHPNEIYTPESGRADIFDGYTFIFYDDTQYNNLLAAIFNGSGKSLLQPVVAEETQVDDFVRYVKSVAGEKGLGSFDDGSEGRGVVVVRYLPAKGTHVGWYTEFFTAVSLQLDHRPIEQSEFLEAILIKDASILRRPLEVESSATQEARLSRRSQTQVEPQTTSNQKEAPVIEESQPPPRRGRARQPVKKRFAGFDNDSDADMDDTPAAPVAEPSQGADEGGLFVSQDPEPPEADSGNTRASPKKRQASPLPEDDLMDGMAPAAARFKRQRIERGEDFATATPDPAPEAVEKAPKKKAKKEMDVLAMAAQHREQAEARARAEKEDMANMPDDVDLAEIRRLNIVEEVEVRLPGGNARTRDQDVADGRWNPQWNGMKNFKKFRQRGEATGRPPARVIVALTEVKNKEFGVGDDYWLEDEDTSQRKKKSQTSLLDTPRSPQPAPAPKRRKAGVLVSDDSDQEQEDSEMVDNSIASGTRNTKTGTQSAANTRTQSSKQTTQSQGKRAAPESSREQPAKRPRPTRKAIEIADSDDSDDELKFRFGKRR